MTAAYHITHVGNIQSMVEGGAILCDSACAARRVDNVSIAHDHIKTTRAQRRVEVAREGTLADYVPFYFAPRSPMLYAIDRGYVDGYEGGQRDIVHLVVAVEEVAEPGRFVVTDGHAAMPLSRHYDDLAALDEAIDWPVMHGRYWFDRDDDGDRKRRRQAEFLVWSMVPFGAVRVIGVSDQTRLRDVRALLAGTQFSAAAGVRADWYY